ncbi:hypothetical protein T265_13455 [Opisthorchis viverrini]|uniref:Uncharacterized protein n=1 Tax=Opisthorchis viverrini TaxID=6198 RepID=A0A075A0G0_OPIVI|nr:hypothetical protein T265_13455 [Opisthorchis viverrini]KER29045.1 hypothetical protein T265_13455 [Opisthorchis viverrini]
MMPIEEAAKFWASIENSSLYDCAINYDWDALIRSEFLPLENKIKELKALCNRLCSEADVLRFEEQRLRTDCEQLQQLLRSTDEERQLKSIEKQSTLLEQNKRLSSLRAKYTMYEQFTGAKLMTENGLATVFISTPDGVIQHCLPIRKEATVPISLNSELKFSSQEIEEIDNLWSKLKLDSSWSDFLTDPPTWYKASHKSTVPGADNKRTALKTINNVS